MVDNLKKWTELCKDDFNGENVHFVQLIQRNKDINKINDFIEPTVKKFLGGYGKHILYFYYFRTAEDLEKNMSTIKKMCNCLKARAYVSLSPLKSTTGFQKILHTLIDTTVNNEDYLLNELANTCFINADKEKQRILLDIDEHMLHCYETIKKTMMNCGAEILAEIPSKTGISLILSDFDITKVYKGRNKEHSELEKYLILDEKEKADGLTDEYMLEHINDIHLMYNTFVNLYIPDFE